jgi:hypothetical protein
VKAGTKVPESGTAYQAEKLTMIADLVKPYFDRFGVQAVGS